MDNRSKNCLKYYKKKRKGITARVADVTKKRLPLDLRAMATDLQSWYMTLRISII